MAMHTAIEHIVTVAVCAFILEKGKEQHGYSQQQQMIETLELLYISCSQL